MNEFIEECRREWRRLGVPDPIANEMAADLAALPHTGIFTQLCGDAHVSNLGAFAAPDGRLVFDINDFDETIRGPFEWDVKRMATSFVLAGREAGGKSSACAEAAAILPATFPLFLSVVIDEPEPERSPLKLASERVWLV